MSASRRCLRPAGPLRSLLLGSCAAPSVPRVPVAPWCPDPAPVSAATLLSCPSTSSPLSHPSAASSHVPVPLHVVPPGVTSCPGSCPRPATGLSLYPHPGFPTTIPVQITLRSLPTFPQGSPLCPFPVSRQAPHPVLVPLHVLPRSFWGAGPDPTPLYVALSPGQA